MEGGEGPAVAPNRWELEDKPLLSWGGLCAGSGAQEPVNDHRRQLLRAGMRQDSRHRDACPGTKAIWKAGMGWSLKGQWEKGQGKDRRARLQISRATWSSRALRILVHSNTVTRSPALLKP